MWPQQQYEGERETKKEKKVGAERGRKGGREKMGFRCPLSLARSSTLWQIPLPWVPLQGHPPGVQVWSFCVSSAFPVHSPLVGVSLSVATVYWPLCLSLHNRKPSIITRNVQNCECFLLNTAWRCTGWHGDPATGRSMCPGWTVQPPNGASELTVCPDIRVGRTWQYHAGLCCAKALGGHEETYRPLHCQS